jgi:WD40 repeat protein
MGQELLTLNDEMDSFKCVAFSPDGKRLAAASLTGRVKLWDAGRRVQPRWSATGVCS